MKFEVPADFSKLVEEHRWRRYQSANKHFTHREFMPDTWHMGEEVDVALLREEPDVVVEAQISCLPIQAHRLAGFFRFMTFVSVSANNKPRHTVVAGLDFSIPDGLGQPGD